MAIPAGDLAYGMSKSLLPGACGFDGSGSAAANDCFREVVEHTP